MRPACRLRCPAASNFFLITRRPSTPLHPASQRKTARAGIRHKHINLAMKQLTILYDRDCPVCRRCRAWLEAQPKFVPLEFLALQSENLARRFPGIEKLDLDKEIVVISDTGEVWQGGEAWVICLWTLREYREWSQRLA